MPRTFNRSDSSRSDVLRRGPLELRKLDGIMITASTRLLELKVAID